MQHPLDSTFIEMGAAALLVAAVWWRTATRSVAFAHVTPWVRFSVIALTVAGISCVVLGELIYDFFAPPGA